MIGKTYIIKDYVDRSWGEFTVKKEKTTPMGSTNIHGYLNPSDQFSEVKNIFTAYNESVSKSSGPNSDQWKDIVKLSPFLVDAETQEMLDIGSMIFIDENLLVTCSIKG